MLLLVAQIEIETMAMQDVIFKIFSMIVYGGEVLVNAFVGGQPYGYYDQGYFNLRLNSDSNAVWVMIGACLS